MEPPLHSGLVGRPPATLGKRIPINRRYFLDTAEMIIGRTMNAAYTNDSAYTRTEYPRRTLQAARWPSMSPGELAPRYAPT